MSATTRVCMTDARADLLLTVADAMATGRPLHPLVERDAVQAFRDLAAQHHRAAGIRQQADPFASDLRGDHDGPAAYAVRYSEAGVAP